MLKYNDDNPPNQQTPDKPSEPSPPTTMTVPQPDTEKHLFTPSALFKIEHAVNHYLKNIDIIYITRRNRSDLHKQRLSLTKIQQAPYKELARNNIKNHAPTPINIRSPPRKPYEKPATAWHSYLIQQRNISKHHTWTNLSATNKTIFRAIETSTTNLKTLQHYTNLLQRGDYYFQYNQHDDFVKIILDSPLIMSKVEGKALEAISDAPATIEVIKNALKGAIKPDNSKNREFYPIYQ